MKNSSALILLLFLFSCGNNAPKCRYGEPVAIFSPTLEAVAQHDFSAEGQNGQEEVVFKNGMRLEVLQSGCNALRQEFRFSLPPAPPQADDEFWKQQGIKLFHFLGDLSTDHAQFHQYARVIEEMSAQMHLGEVVSVGDGFSLRMDKVSGMEQTILQVEVAQGSEK